MADIPGGILHAENVQLVLTRYAIRRLLFRLTLTQHRDRFVLKGVMLFSLWTPTSRRATGDLDLLGYGDAGVERVTTAFRGSAKQTLLMMASPSTRTLCVPRLSATFPFEGNALSEAIPCHVGQQSNSLAC